MSEPEELRRILRELQESVFNEARHLKLAGCGYSADKLEGFVRKSVQDARSVGNSEVPTAMQNAHKFVTTCCGAPARARIPESRPFGMLECCKCGTLVRPELPAKR